MGAIVDFFKGIGDFVVSLWNYFLQTLEELWTMIQLLGEVIAQVPSYLNWLPAAIIEIIGVILAVAVLYKILGRDG